jgi:hypothetical protein
MASEGLTWKDLLKNHRKMLLDIAVAFSDESELPFAEFEKLVQAILKEDLGSAYPSSSDMEVVVKALWSDYIWRMWKRGWKRK